MAEGAVRVASEYGDFGILVAFAVFAADIVFESARAGGEEAEFVPATRASVRAQRGEVGCGYDGEVHVLGEVDGVAVEAVNQAGAHGAGLGLALSVHQVIDDERAAGGGEEFAQEDGAVWRASTRVMCAPYFSV